MEELVRYYDKYADKGIFTARTGELIDYRFWDYRTDYYISINSEGEILDLINNQEERVEKDGKIKMLGKYIVFPFRAARSGNFSYPFEIRPKMLFNVDKKFNFVEDKDYFSIAKKQNVPMLEGVDSPIAKAMYIFFTKYERNAAYIDRIKKHFEGIKGSGELKYTFILDGDITTAWNKDKAILARYFELQDKDEDAIARYGTDIVYGEADQPLVRLHEGFKSIVKGTNPKNAKLVSLNLNCDKGYSDNGKEQTAAVSNLSRKSVLKYVFMLNWLSLNPNHAVKMNEYTIMFWCSDDFEEETDSSTIFNKLFNSSWKKSESKAEDVKSIMHKVGYKTFTDEDFDFIEKHKNSLFKVIGLAISNGESLAIKYDKDVTVDVMFKGVKQFIEDMRVEEEQRISIPSILKETDNRAKKWRDFTYANKNIISSLYEAIIWNKELPHEIYRQMLMRCWYEAAEIQGAYGKTNLTRNRLGYIKAYLNRKYRKANKEEIKMGLDVERTNVGYLLGRWLAVIEKMQKDKLKNVNCSIKDKYFKMLGSTPLVVFAQANRESQVYKCSLKLTKLYDEILSKIEGNVPKRLTMEEQGEFVLGYSHQRSNLYTKKEYEELYGGEDAMVADDTDSDEEDSMED